MSTMSPTGSRVEEAEAFLAAHPEIEAFDIVLHDSNAIARGKIIRRHELLAVYKAGRHLPISILGLDVFGEDVGETGLIWDQGDRDMRAWPVPGTLTALPGTSPARGEVLLSLYDLDGTPMLSDPRHALQRRMDAFAARGLHPAGAFELEFFLLARERDGNGRVRPAAAILDGRPAEAVEVYSVDALIGMEPLFSQIYAGAEAAGIRAETVISEYAPGQYEMTLHYRASLMQAADDLVRLKRIVRGAARRFGVTACFMAKPMEGHAGSGMHVHVSLQDGDGRNVFAGDGEGGTSAALRHAIGGLRAHMGESMLVFAPHANSWRRFVSESYAPVSDAWGINNRSVALRVPAGPAASRRVEHRVSGVDANPHLVATAILAAMADGMDRSLDPGAPVTGNGYDGQTRAVGPMPRDWWAAIEAASGSGFLKAALGEEMHRTFVAVKRAEHARLAREIPEQDYRAYLTTI